MQTVVAIPSAAATVESCCICMEPIHSSAKYLSCHHVYHSHCIDAWAAHSAQHGSTSYPCPICRHYEGLSSAAVVGEVEGSLISVRFARDRAFIKFISLSQGALALGIVWLCWSPGNTVLAKLHLLQTGGDIIVSLLGWFGAQYLNMCMLLAYLLCTVLAASRDVVLITLRAEDNSGLTCASLVIQTYVAVKVVNVIQNMQSYRRQLTTHLSLF